MTKKIALLPLAVLVALLALGVASCSDNFSVFTTPSDDATAGTDAVGGDGHTTADDPLDATPHLRVGERGTDGLERRRRRCGGGHPGWFRRPGGSPCDEKDQEKMHGVGQR